MGKSKVIIYGLGKQYELRKRFLESKFNIIGYSDKEKRDIEKFVEPNELNNYEFQYIYITSCKYYKEIKEELIKKYYIDETKIIGEKSTCWYIDNSIVRDKWVIAKLNEIAEGKVLLDAGAGELHYKKYCNHLNYISQDFGLYDKVEKIEGLQHDIWDTSKVDIISDITNIPLEDSSVDAILCTEVFEHIKNPLLAVQEFYRLLRMNGVLLLTAPFCSLTHFAPYYFTNGFSKYWYQEILKDFHFEIEEIVANGNYFDYLRQELLRIPYMAQEYIGEAQITDKILDVLVMLEELSKKDIKSSEVLCFGYMVKAKKVL